ncbi:hypothetical protein [Streptomyces eurythermus]
MTETNDQQPRLPGVRYRKVPLEREETTVIDGITSTRKVPYTGWEPVPPRDWDDLILRGVTAVTLGVTGLAVIATTASVGGLLVRLIPGELAYAVGVVFTATWLCCHGVEWLQMMSGREAWTARIAGWAALAISMGAVITYGHTLDQTAAGVIGGSIDLLSKGLLTLVMGLYRVQLDPGPAHWLREQEQRLSSKAYLAVKLRRINRHAAYLRAVGGREVDVAEAITQRTETPVMLSATVQQPAPTPTAQATLPVPPVPSGPAPQPAQVPATVLAPAPTAPAAPTAPVGSSAGPSGTAFEQGPDTSAGEPKKPEPGPSPVLPMAPSIRQIVLKALDEDLEISTEDLLERVKAVHGDRPKLAATVETYHRKEKKLRSVS